MKHGTVCTICTPPPPHPPPQTIVRRQRTSVPSPCSNTAACTFGSCKSWTIPATSYQRQNVVTGSSIIHSTPSRIFLIISRNTGKSCASPLVTVQDTIFLPFTSVTMCSLTNSRLEMTPFDILPLSMLDYDNSGGVACQRARCGNAADRVATFKLKCAKHSFKEIDPSSKLRLECFCMHSKLFS